MRDFIVNKLIYVFYFCVILFVGLFVFYILNNQYSFAVVTSDVSLLVGTNYVPDIIPNNEKYIDYSNYDWSSQDESIVTVDSFGNINAVSSGETKIKIKSKKGFHVKYINITVLAEEIKSISFENDSVNLNIGDIYKIEPYVNGKKNLMADLNYSVENSTILSINEDGVVNALAVGETKVYASSVNGVHGELKIIVTKQAIEVESIKLSTDDISIEKGDSVSLIADIYPLDADDKNISWISSNRDVASINNGVVTALSEGTTTITATTSNGKTATCTVTVKKIEATAISLNKNSTSIYIGSSETLTANISPSNTTNKAITWTSSNPSVASINNGVVTALSEGTTKITATTSNGKTATCTVTVINKRILPVGIHFESTNITTEYNQTLILKINFSPSNVTERNLTWISSNPSVASINNGVVTALSEGTTKITATTSNGKTATCTVTVKKIEATNISLNKTSTSIYIGSSETLTANISPSNTTNKAITWTSSNPSVASINNGVVTALSEGTTKITATTSNGKTATCTVTVKKIEATAISLNKTSTSIYIGSSETLTASISPSNTTNKTITWKSSNPSVASVNNGIVTALSEGTTTITATTSNGKTATCTVTVKKIEATSISLNKTSTSINIGSSETLSASISPSNTTNKTITWTSSNPSVASINNGVVTALSEGTTKITATTSNGKTATCTVSVKSNTFTNPLVNGADPWVIKYGKTYYYSYSCGGGGKSICISSFEKLSSLSRGGKIVYTNAGSNVWAPELHYINGKWYIYYSVTKGGNNGASGRRMYVLSSNNPTGTYTYEGQITDSTDNWAIDGTVLQWNGQLYFIWSGAETREPPTVAQNIYIAHMSNPITIDSDRVMISAPQYNWEIHGAKINEGPEVLIKNGQLHIIYSASATQNQYYCLGMLTFNGGDILNKNSWIKSSQPVFQAGNGVLGPGHASFVKSPDGTEDWIVYHAYTDQDAINNYNRTIRIQKFYWNGNKPVFGEPVASNTPIQKPSGE